MKWIKAINKIANVENKGLEKSFILGIISLFIAEVHPLVIDFFTNETFVGQVSYYLNITLLIATMSILGMDNVILKKFSENKSITKNEIVFLINIFVRTTLISFFIATTYYYFGHLSVFIIPFSIILSSYFLISYVYQTKLKASSSLFFRKLIIPLITIIYGFIVWYKDNLPSINSLLITWIIVLTMLFIFLFGTATLKINKKLKGTPYIDYVILYKESFKFYLFTIAFLLINISDILILKFYADYATLGTYTIASKMAKFSLLGLISINTFMPIVISKYYKLGNTKRLQKILTLSSRFATLIFIISFCLLLFFCVIYYENHSNRNMIISVFLISSIGVFINVACGSCGFLLNMTGLNKFSSKILLKAVLLNIALNILLGYYFQAIGIALSTTISVSYINVAMMLLANKKLKLNSSIF